MFELNKSKALIFIFEKKIEISSVTYWPCDMIAFPFKKSRSN